MTVSGKYVIIGILAVAFSAAAASWWFRYSTTGRAARFWGPNGARLIRDAPIVEFYEFGMQPDADYQKPINRRDISHARGLIHLRNALLEDRSFDWPPENPVPGSFGYGLEFRDKNDAAVTLIFTSDWQYVGKSDGSALLSCEPIAAGLAKFVAELSPGAIDPPR